MASEAIRLRPPVGGAIGFAPTGRGAGRGSGRGAASAAGRGASPGSGGAITGRLRPPAARPYTPSLGPVAGAAARRSAGEAADRGAGATEPAAERRTGGRRTIRAESAGLVWTGERHGPDTTVLAIALALTALGILMVFSSSAMQQYAAGNSPFETAAAQLMFAAVGVVGMLAMMVVPYHRLRLFALPALLVSAVLLGLLFTPLAHRIGGSAQWLQIPGLPAIQPGEFVKLALVIYLASWMHHRGTALGGIATGFVPFAIIIAPFILAIFVAPDMGSAGVLGMTAVLMFFLAGGSLVGLAGMAVIGTVGALAATLVRDGYQLARLSSFLDPFANPTTNGYQTVQGLLSIGLGGLFGAGLGDRAAAGGISLPNAHNDYIFAVVGQETGLVGAGLVIIGFVVLAWRGLQISRQAPTTFGALLAAGITAWLCVQAFINIGVVVALLPVTGITLPFVSAGGSSLIVSLVAIGILLSVSRETVPAGGWVDASGDRGRRHGRAHLPSPGRRPVALRTPGRA
jgi:cell division protein FtsW